MRPLMTLAEAAAQTPFNPATLRRAIKTTDPSVFPPPLKAKQDGRGRYLITAKALTEWIESLEDA